MTRPESDIYHFVPFREPHLSPVTASPTAGKLRNVAWMYAQEEKGMDLVSIQLAPDTKSLGE